MRFILIIIFLIFNSSVSPSYELQEYKDILPKIKLTHPEWYDNFVSDSRSMLQNIKFYVTIDYQYGVIYINEDFWNELTYKNKKNILRILLTIYYEETNKLDANWRIE